MNEKTKKFLEDLRIEIEWSKYQSKKHSIETAILFDDKNLVSVAMPFKDLVEYMKDDKKFLKKNGLSKMRDSFRSESNRKEKT